MTCIVFLRSGGYRDTRTLTRRFGASGPASRIASVICRVLNARTDMKVKNVGGSTISTDDTPTSTRHNVRLNRRGVETTITVLRLKQ
jgi:hypothetical protein